MNYTINGRLRLWRERPFFVLGDAMTLYEMIINGTPAIFAYWLRDYNNLLCRQSGGDRNFYVIDKLDDLYGPGHISDNAFSVTARVIYWENEDVDWITGSDESDGTLLVQRLPDDRKKSRVMFQFPSNEKEYFIPMWESLQAELKRQGWANRADDQPARKSMAVTKHGEQEDSKKGNEKWLNLIKSDYWKIIELWNKDYTANEIHERVGFSPGRIRNIITEQRKRLASKYGKKEAAELIKYHRT